jgi:hypothetical protein
MNNLDTSSIRAHMKVVGMDHQPVGTVDHVDGGRVKLAKNDPLSNGEHHWLPQEWIDRVEDDVVCLSKSARDARQQWQSQ